MHFRVVWIDLVIKINFLEFWVIQIQTQNIRSESNPDPNLTIPERVLYF